MTPIERDKAKRTLGRNDSMNVMRGMKRTRRALVVDDDGDGEGRSGEKQVIKDKTTRLGKGRKGGGGKTNEKSEAGGGNAKENVKMWDNFFPQ